MKFILVASALVAGLCTVKANGEATPDMTTATALFSDVAHVQNDLALFTNQQLDKSFDFLLLAFAFDRYDSDRPGFEKLYRKISDRAWEDTVKLIKYQSRRGLTAKLGKVNSPVLSKAGGKTLTKNDLAVSDEMDSLKVALGYEKVLAEESHKMHKKISHAHSEEKHYDPDVAHFLDEEFIEYQSGTVRKLAGYLHNLNSIFQDTNSVGETGKTKDLGLHLFDEYLDKVE